VSLVLADLIRKAYSYNSVVTTYVFGNFGYGKTSYALWVAYYVLGDWGKVLKHLFFDPREAVDVMGKAIKTGKRLPIIIMDDAGLWLDKMTWWEEDKIAFMQFFNLIRNVSAGVIFTTPSEDLPKAIKRKCMFRVSVRPASKEELMRLVGEDAYEELQNVVSRYNLAPLVNIATGYRLKTLPSFMEFVKKEYIDTYPLHYPIYAEYEEKRRKALKHYFNRWVEKVGREERSRKEKAYELARELIEDGKDSYEVVKKLINMGIPRTTAYRWVEKLTKIKQTTQNG